MIVLTVLEGAPEATRTFNEDVVSIGRSSENNFCIRETSLSRKHCEIAAVGGKFILVNHARTNGTLVNGQPVGETVLKRGDTILAGRISLRFEGNGEKMDKESAGGFFKHLRRRKRPD
jgi:pSer/pThr/pTyr-binding forkhead associated (FHA) protein